MTQHLATTRTMAAAERSMSSSVVDQFETEMRIACWSCQRVPPSQHVPSAWMPAMTARVSTSGSRSSWGSMRSSTWLRTTSLRIDDARFLAQQVRHACREAAVALDKVGDTGPAKAAERRVHREAASATR